VIQQIAQRKLYQPLWKLEKIEPVKQANGRWELEHPLR
jgi:hypothetical protein